MRSKTTTLNLQDNPRNSERKHDRVRSDLERWEDPWLWVFRLHDDCEWWNTCSVVSESMGNDLENPRPGKRHKYV